MIKRIYFLLITLILTNILSAQTEDYFITQTIGQVNYPYGIAVDSSQNLYIANTGDNTIIKIENILFAAPQEIIDSSKLTSPQMPVDSFPQGIAIDSAGNIYIANTANHKISKFDSNGDLIDADFIGIGSAGTGNGEHCACYRNI